MLDLKEIFETISVKQWQHSGNLYKYFWLEIKKEKSKLCGSSISLFADKYGVKIILEFDGKQADKYDNAYEIHNSYLETIKNDIYSEDTKGCIFWIRKKNNNIKAPYGDDYKHIIDLIEEYEKKK